MLDLRNLDMFVWMSSFQNSFAHTHFNMFADECTSANESPEEIIFCVWRKTSSVVVPRALLVGALEKSQHLIHDTFTMTSIKHKAYHSFQVVPRFSAVCFVSCW